jgi:hypothetical protein
MDQPEMKSSNEFALLMSDLPTAGASVTGSNPLAGRSS